MKHLYCDLETYSEAPIAKTGAFRYVDDPSFEILLCSFGETKESVRCLDLKTSEEDRRFFNTEYLDILTDPTITKHAYNAPFEIACLWPIVSKAKGWTTEREQYAWFSQWQDTALHARYCGLPGSLDGVGKALGFDEDKAKMKVGKALIRTFSIPRKPTARDDRTRVMPQDEPEKWALYKEYNIQDVVSEIAVDETLEPWPVPYFIQAQWVLDLVQQFRGVKVDMDLVRGALKILDQNTNEYMEEARQLSGLENPNSIAQLKAWLADAMEEDVPESLSKGAVSELLATLPEGSAKRVLEIRQELCKTSTKKYESIAQCACHDDRVRGLLQFYGAGKTGRWSGRLCQPQNLPRVYLHGEELRMAREITQAGDIDSLRFGWGNVTDTLSQVIRTAFTADPGELIFDADYSAIECRVLSWLSGEEWVLDVFRTSGKIYEATASRAFGVPMERIVKGNPEYELRQRGKTATLACIAEGELVLTNHGKKVIEDVELTDLVWDGEEWVAHEGVIYKGEREVITYEGLTATEDHLVFIEGQDQPVHLGIAAASGMHLRKSGTCRDPLWMGRDNQPGGSVREVLETPRSYGRSSADQMHELRQGELDRLSEPSSWKDSRLPNVHGDVLESEDPVLAEQAYHVSETALRESERQTGEELRRSRNPLRIQLGSGVRSVCDEPLPEHRGLSGDGAGPDRQQPGLRTGEPEIRIAERELREPENHSAERIRSEVLAVLGTDSASETCTRGLERRDDPTSRSSSQSQDQKLANDKRTARVYDIRNAGERHRFTVSGILVHNCGYQGGAAAMARMDFTHAIDPALYPGIVKQWREANPETVKLWSKVNAAMINAVRTGRSDVKLPHATLKFRLEKGNGLSFLTMELPSGRKLFYAEPKIGTNRFGSESISYMSVNQTTRKWERSETYGGHAVENATQGTARDLLAYSIRLLENAGVRIVFHVHDEIVATMPADKMTIEQVEQIMGTAPAWADGLPLKAEGWTDLWFRKD